MYKSFTLHVAPMPEESRRTSTEIFTRSGGVFWGLVLLVVGLLWLLVTLNVIVLDLGIVWPLLVLLGGIYLIVTKVL